MNDSSPVTFLLAELVILGVRLEVNGNLLRFCPRSKVTPVLCERITQHKAELLDVLQNITTITITKTPVPDSASGGFGDGDDDEPSDDDTEPALQASPLPKAPVSSDADIDPTTEPQSVSTPEAPDGDAEPPSRTYSAYELALLEKAPPDVRQTIDEVGEAFANTGGVTLVSIQTVRQRAAAIIREARLRGDTVGAVTLRDAWCERMACCTIDGNVPEIDVRRIALDEMEAM